MNTAELDEGELEYSAADRWIESRLDHATEAVHKHLGNYRLDLAAQALYEFTWHEFCDWYLELSKPVLQSDAASAAERRATRRTLIDTLEALLCLLHPIMPFITEEIWLQVAPVAGIDGETIMLRRFPETGGTGASPEAVADIEWVREFILGIRQIRGEMDVPPGKPVPVLMDGASDDDRRRAGRYAHLLARVGRIESVTTLEPGETAPPSATALLGDLTLQVPMKGLIDLDAERKRLEKQIGKLRSERAQSNAKLDNERFVNNAPAAVVQQERDRLADFDRQLDQLNERLTRLDALD